MIEVMQSHFISIIVIVFTLLVTPFYWFLLLPTKKATIMAWITAVVGAVMTTMVLFNVTGLIGRPGGAIIGAMWIVPPLIVWIKRDWFRGLNQRTLVSLQIFRLIGAVFILEMVRGNIPSSFALPAGIGDVIVGLFAIFLLLSYKKIPRLGLITLIVIGLLDFISAFFFGFTSFDGRGQLFAFGFENKLNLFPTGLIPIFLVPYAITFHILSLINLPKE